MALRAKARDSKGNRSAGPIGSVWVRCRRPVTAVTLAFLVYWAGAPWNYAEAAQLARSARSEPAVAAQTDAGPQLAARVQETESALAAVRAGDAGALAQRADELEARFTGLMAIDGQVRASFLATQKHLEKARLPPEIVQRHRAAVARYEVSFDQLKKEMAQVLSLSRSVGLETDRGRDAVAAKRQQQLPPAVAEATRLLAEMSPPPARTALDPNKLPHRLAKAERRLPRLKAEEFTELRARGAQRPAGAGRVKVQGFATKAAGPGPQDLAPTLEVQLTPEIAQRAAALGGDPLQILAFVRNNIAFTPTRGSIQGAAACLKTRLCNDMDTASLMIALLRSSGIPARYASGTVEIGIDKVKNLAGGFADGNAALNFIASSGTPVTGLTSGGVLTAARLEHVWVEAFLDFVPSRGAVHGPADTWVPLDPSFKQLAFTAGIDVLAATGLNPDTFLNQLVTGATGNADNDALLAVDVAGMEQKLSAVQGQIVAFANGRGTQATAFNTLGGSAIVPATLSVLPGSLPYHVIVRGGQFSEVPDALRHSLRFEVSPDSFGLAPALSYTASLPQLAGKRITLSYAPATAADQATLDSFVPRNPTSAADLPTSLPGYLVQVVPELRIDGAVVATGGSATLGQAGRFQMFFNQPGGESDVVDNTITAGTYNAIVLNLGVTGDAAAARQAAQAKHDQIARGDFTGLTKDDVMGDFLHAAGQVYWTQIELFEKATANVRRIASSRLPGEGIFTYDLKVQTLFGVPRTVSSGALMTDVDRDVIAAGSLDGDTSKIVSYLTTTGGFASRTESSIYDQSVSAVPAGAGINAMSYIEAAARQGIPIFHITSANLARVLPQLAVSSAVKTDIQNSINAGKVVTIPQREFLKDGFFGVGYIVLDLTTGAAGYLISSGLAGGGFQLPPLGPLATFLLGILLVGIGAIALEVGIVWLVIAAAVALIALAIYDAVSTYQEIARDNPNLTPDQLSAIGGILAMIALVTIVLAIVGIFGGPLGILAFAVYWAFASVMLEEVLKFYLNLIRNQIPPNPLTARRLLKRIERLARDLWGAPRQQLRPAGGLGAMPGARSGRLAWT